jgi:transcriptional regulator with XRE-family HTH domain
MIHYDENMALASARLCYQLLGVLHAALGKSGMTQTNLAAQLKIRKSAVSQTFNGSGNVQPATLAMYLCAMGFELEIRVVPLGTARQRAVLEMAIAENIRNLDGSTKSRVALLTGLSPDEIDRLGGIEGES